MLTPRTLCKPVFVELYSVMHYVNVWWCQTLGKPCSMDYVSIFCYGNVSVSLIIWFRTTLVFMFKFLVLDKFQFQV
jgi:hypothetical protein